MLTAKKVTTRPTLDSSDWQKSPSFVDMATGGPAVLNTQAAFLWDDENLYVAFWIDEPNPTAKLTERGSLIFQENDVELFIDGGDCYYEFEINALGTVYEMFFIWKDAFHKFDQQEFDVHKRRAYTFGGDFDRTPETFWDGNHPRGIRWAFRDFELAGLQTKVEVDGTLNQPEQRSKGWTVEMTIPWQSLKLLTNGRTLPPKDGDIWNFFIGRFQKIAIGEKDVQAAWCVTPHGRFDTHMPEKFTPVVFKA